MATLDEQLAKIRKEIAGLREIEYEFQGKKKTLDVSGCMFYACGFTGILIENILALARNERELDMTGEAVDMIIKEVITQGSMTITPIAKEVVGELPPEEIKPERKGYLKNLTKDQLAGYQ